MVDAVYFIPFFLKPFWVSVLGGISATFLLHPSNFSKTFQLNISYFFPFVLVLLCGGRQANLVISLFYFIDFYMLTNPAF
jgi:hypothetical protein